MVGVKEEENDVISFVDVTLAVKQRFGDTKSLLSGGGKGFVVQGGGKIPFLLSFSDLSQCLEILKHAKLVVYIIYLRNATIYIYLSLSIPKYREGGRK